MLEEARTSISWPKVSGQAGLHLPYFTGEPKGDTYNKGAQAACGYVICNAKYILIVKNIWKLFSIGNSEVNILGFQDFLISHTIIKSALLWTLEHIVGRVEGQDTLTGEVNRVAISRRSPRTQGGNANQTYLPAPGTVSDQN